MIDINMKDHSVDIHGAEVPILIYTLWTSLDDEKWEQIEKDFLSDMVLDWNTMLGAREQRNAVERLFLSTELDPVAIWPMGNGDWSGIRHEVTKLFVVKDLGRYVTIIGPSSDHDNIELTQYDRIHKCYRNVVWIKP